MIKAVPIPLENGLTGWLHAGPTKDLPPGYMLIRCAEEIPVAEEYIAYDLGVRDFATFEEENLDAALPGIIEDLEVGRPLYVGCMGGTGRTGTLLALLVAQHPAFTGGRAIDYIRQVYKPGAIETKDQEKQVRTYVRIDSRYGAGLNKSPYPEITEGNATRPHTEQGWVRRLFSRIWAE